MISPWRAAAEGRLNSREVLASRRTVLKCSHLILFGHDREWMQHLWRLGLFIFFRACIETQSGLLPFSDGNVYKIDHTAGGVGRGCCAFRRQIIAWILFIAYERYVG